VTPDEDLVDGIEAERRKIAALVDRLNPPKPDPSPSAMQEVTGLALEGLGTIVADFIFNFNGPEKSPTARPRPRSRFTSSSQPAIAAPRPPQATVPPSAPPAQPAQIPREGTLSGTPDFSAHLEDRKLDLNESPGPQRTRSLRGPIIDSRE
jgi:hypothetical protein